jgi:hypothetical protein
MLKAPLATPSGEGGNCLPEAAVMAAGTKAARSLELGPNDMAGACEVPLNLVNASKWKVLTPRL